MLHNNKREIYIITLPPEVGEHGDITDYLTKLKGDPQDLLTKYAKPYPEKMILHNFNRSTLKIWRKFSAWPSNKTKKTKSSLFFASFRLLRKTRNSTSVTILLLSRVKAISPPRSLVCFPKKTWLSWPIAVRPLFFTMSVNTTKKWKVIW